MKKEKIIIILNIIIITLLSINLFFTIKPTQLPNVNTAIEKTTRSILSIIPEKDLSDYVTTLTQYTNSSQYYKIFDMFSEWTKNQISEEELQEACKKINNLTGKVNNFYYSYNEYLGFSEGAEWFNVFFNADFENGQGTIKLNFRIIEGNNEITGFRYNIEDIK